MVTQHWSTASRVVKGAPLKSPHVPSLPSMPAWYAEALCAQIDPERFFPEKGGSTKDAKATCRSCHVREQCLKYALDNDERYGIWGGFSERERRALKRRRTT